MNSSPADPGATGRFVRFLRDLADYLDQATAIPGPGYGACLILHAIPADQGGRAQVDRIAQLMDVAADDDTDDGGPYWAARNFGPIGYQAVAISQPPPATDSMPVCYQAVTPPAPSDAHS
jgi:hypothetical protein